MIDGKFCVRKAFIDMQRMSSNSTDKNKRQSASSSSPCNCEFCKRKRQETEYDKTVRLLNLMKGVCSLRY
jgi:hypothetical protein